jgi:nitrogen fixation/metabolism regulation signal transduction histidine kinase
MEAFHLHTGDPEKRAISRALRLSLIFSVALAAILLVILATATANTTLFQEHYPLLLWLTGIVAACLFVLVLELLRRLVNRYRRGLFGTRLMARMATVFVAMTVLPVALIFVVAVQFIGRSIESWFDVPVEQALESGLSLGRASLDSQMADLTQKARAMARELVDTPQAAWPQTLNRLRDQAGVQDSLIASGTGRIVTASGSQYLQLVPDLPPASALRQARITRLYANIDTGDAAATKDARDGRAKEHVLKLRVIVPIALEGQRTDDARFLQLVQPVPSALATHAEAVQQGYAGYKALSGIRGDLKKLYRITLSLIFLLTLFSAVAAAFVLAGWLIGPLSELAAATRSVAEGDFRPVKDYTTRGELGVLTRSFNVMTRQLQEARAQVDRNQRELEQANARLESVLSNLDAGVLVLDSDLKLTLANPGAERILAVDLSEHIDRPLAEIPRIGELAKDIRAAFNEQAAAGLASWQRQFSLHRDATRGERAPDGSADQTILARGSLLPERRVGYVIVFDDISQVISGQRAVAWAEVARRLAHEIKNPLTPIQLAAERMERKLHDRLSGADAEFLHKNSQTIINQVSALSIMVDEFRDYARLPAANLAPVNLNALIDDVLHLYSGTGRGVSMRVELAGDLPEILGDRTQLRQVVHNLVKNALEATEGRERPMIEVLTERLVMSDGALAVRALVRDNGGGFSPAMLARAFEPYVTSKSKGTGLGLAIVKKILEEHGARIDVGNWTDPSDGATGAQISILFTKLPKSVENPGFVAATR